MASFIPSNKIDLNTELVVTLYQEGMNLDEISKKFNCSVTPVMRILKENNIKRRQHYQSGDKHPYWKGGRFLHKGDGYFRRGINGSKIKEHRYIWIQENQMPIPKGFVIHHNNGIKTDNRIENLTLLPERFHHTLHNKVRIMENPQEKYFGRNQHLRSD